MSQEKYARDIEDNFKWVVVSVEIQQEDPSEKYAPALGWSLGLFLDGSLFLDDEQILFINDVYL